MEKYHMPLISDSYIKRTRLVSLINSLSNRNILFIHAPAGYGKTTATAQWIETKKIKTAWFSLDEYDSDIDFYKGILLAFLNSEIGSENSALVSDTLNNKDFYMNPLNNIISFFNKFELSNNFALVIDDFHLCNNSNVFLSLPVLRKRLPVNLRFIVISRNLPPKLLNEYILKEIIKQISIEQLKFDKDEILKLLVKNNFKPADFELEKIENQTLGWPAVFGSFISYASKDNFVLFNPKINNSGYLYNYIKYLVFEFWDGKSKDILLKTSVCSFFNPELCEKLSGQKNCWDIISRLYKKTGLVLKLGLNKFCYHKLLKDFLLHELENEKGIDKKDLYYKSAVWYKENDYITEAMTMATEIKNIPMIEDILRLYSSSYGKFNIGVEEYVNNINFHVLQKLSDDIIKKSPRLCLENWFYCFVSGKLEESEKYMVLAKKYLSLGYINNFDDLVMAFFQFSADISEDPWFIIDLMKIIEPDNINKNYLPAFTLTYNMPFYHKAQRDYSEISNCLPEYINGLEKYLSKTLGSYYKILTSLIEGGILLERFEIQKAKEKIFSVLDTAKNSPPELLFSSLMLAYYISWIEGDLKQLKKLQLQTDKMITDSKAFYLYPNFKASVTNTALYDGDKDISKNWLKNNDADISLYRSFQNLTTAKSLIVSGDIIKALEYIDKLLVFFRTYRRRIDYIETGTLKSLCLWYLKRYDESVNIFIDILSLAQKYCIVTPVIKYGKDIIPILQKIINRLKIGLDTEKLDKEFIGNLFFQALVFEEKHEGFFANMTTKPVKLSKRQALMLEYLSQNLTYQEMAQMTDTKITTIRDHITKLYQKLGVNNSTDAVIRGREEGFL